MDTRPDRQGDSPTGGLRAGGFSYDITRGRGATTGRRPDQRTAQQRRRRTAGAKPTKSDEIQKNEKNGDFESILELFNDIYLYLSIIAYNRPCIAVLIAVYLWRPPKRGDSPDPRDPQGQRPQERGTARTGTGRPKPTTPDPAPRGCNG